MQGASRVGAGNSLVLVMNLGGAHNDNQNISNSSKALQEVIAKLAQALLKKDGGLDESSPLGKMLAKAMAQNGKSGGGIEDIIAALDKLIHDKLGDNFGASADMNAGSGSGAGNEDGGGVGGDAGGQSDLTTQVLNGLAKAMLDDLLTPDSQGSSLSKDNLPMLEKIGQFMDDNKAQFPASESGSWKNQLTQNTQLGADDTKTLRAALDMLSQLLGKQQNDSGISGGGLGSPLTDSTTSPDETDDSTLNTNPASNVDNGGNGDSGLGHLLGDLLERGLQSTISGGGLGTPLGGKEHSSGKSGHGDPLHLHDLGQLLGGLIEKGLKASPQDDQKKGSDDLKISAELTAALLVSSLLQGNNKPVLS
ncbi:harpin HrpZ family protein [Pseudomonas cannabina]|uniref:Harpin protein HrpZ n=1 Tax=Pseudomonas cannabina TaxID=86840 RepID=A0A0P9LJV0_PSECA|nr:harpin HrpZ family protein [Pseudomonas cannabina]KAA8712066.1 type III secretion protein HrpZ [Pseudomonas cannabina]KPW78074.1 hypothetical protein ALO81_01237 [Pseudomonas cannabina]RMN29909.1 Harpin protein HrpZ [Pseudomonas cannabina]SDQ49785.1 HrpZ protein [Pseudomonas cannabina]